MKRKLLFLPFAALLSFAGCNLDDDYNDRNGDKEVIPPVGTTIKMMTYNIYGARADHGIIADLDAIAEVIRKQDPDFVALQEIDVYTNRTGSLIHQAKDLAEKLGMNWHFSPARDMSPGYYGDAVLSKHKILEALDYKMTAPYGGETRSVCVIKVSVEGEPLYVMSTHLSHESEENRTVQASELRDIINATGGNIVIGGDFNATPGAESMTTVRSYLTAASQGKFESTYPSDNPAVTIDYILYTPLENFSTENYTVLSRADQQVKGEDASDHLPVVATLKMKVKEHISPGQPDNIVVSFADGGVREVLDSETDEMSAEITVERDVDAETTFITLEAMSENDVLTMLPTGETYTLLQPDQWSINKETFSFAAGDMSKTVKVSFMPPETVDVDTYFVLGLTMTSTTPEVTFDPNGDKIVFRVKVSADALPRGSGTQDDPYLIYNLKDMMTMKEKIDAAGDKAEVYFLLMEDIDLRDQDWNPLQNPVKADQLDYRIIHFDGNDHTIKNLTCTDKNRASFFGQLIGSCANVTFENAVISTESGASIGVVASLVGHKEQYDNGIYTEISNTHVSGGTLTAPGNIPVGGDSDDRNGAIGGICGILRFGSIITNCSVQATITGTEAGGIAGDCDNGTIQGSFYQGDVSGSGGNSESHIGGIVGFATNCTIKNCYTGGTVTSADRMAGGITGWQYNNFTISCCYSTSQVSGNLKTGGISGVGESNNSVNEYCIPWNGVISSMNDASSGLVCGWVKGNPRTLRGCYYQPDIKLIISGVEVDYTLKPGGGGDPVVYFYQDWINENHPGTNRYNGLPGKGSLKETALMPELGWDTSVWDLTGDSPKLQWENKNP